MIEINRKVCTDNRHGKMSAVCYNAWEAGCAHKGGASLPVLYDLVSYVCHQADSRTLSLAGRILPLCARCTGIYAGFLIAAAYQAVLPGRNGRQLPARPVSAASLVLILLLAADGVAARWGASLPGNPARVLLGLGGGFSLSLFAVPLFNRFVRASRTDSPVIGGWKAYVPGLLVTAALSASLLSDAGAAFHLWSMASTAGLAATYLVTNAAAAAAILRWPSRPHTAGRTALLAAAVALLLAAEALLLKMASGAAP